MRDSEESCDECPEPEVLEEYAPAVELFCCVASQWREGGHGLDYTAVESAARMLGVEDMRGTFLDLIALERAYLEARRG